MDGGNGPTNTTTDDRPEVYSCSSGRPDAGRVRTDGVDNSQHGASSSDGERPFSSWTNHLRATFVAPKTPDKFGLTVQVENFHDFSHELSRMAPRHFVEVEGDAYPCDPDYESWERAEDAGSLGCFTIRLGKALVGYLIFSLGMHTASRHVITAYEEGLYVDHGVRSFALINSALSAAMDAMKATGVNRVVVSTRHKGDPRLNILLARRGFSVYSVQHEFML